LDARIPRLPAVFRACILPLLANALALGAVPEPPAAGAPPPTNPRFTGSPFMRAWTAEDYDAAPVNYAVLQHPANGLLYAANNYGVLEFDGVTWRLIELPNRGVARTLAVDPQGRVWVGGTDEVAWLEPDATGVLRARSALERLPAAEQALGPVLFSAQTANGVWFGTTRRILFFGADGSARAWSPPEAVTSLTAWQGAVLVTTTAGAWFRLTGEGFVPVAATGGPILAAEAQSGAGWRILTPFGPAEWAGPGAPLVPIGREAANFFQAEAAHSAVFLPDGRMVFGRVVGGAALFDRSGHLLQVIDRTHGLPSNRVEQLGTDREGGLWIAQRAGLARVQLESPFAKHGVAQGVEGRPRALQRHAGRLYVAHNEGAAWRDDATGQFHAIGGLAIGLSRFTPIGPRLFGTSNAIYEVTPETVTPLIPRGVTPLVPLPGTPPERPWLLGGGSGSAWLFSPDGNTWKIAGALAHLPADVASLLPTTDGFVWGASSDGRIWRMDFRDGPRLDAPVELYGPEKGVPQVRPRDAELFLLGSDVLATSSAWILRHDPTTDRFVPETRIAGLPADATAIRAHADARGTLWLQLGPPSGQLVQIQPDGPGRWRAEPLASPAVAGLVANRIYHDEVAQTLWIASQGALVSIDLAWRPSRPPPPAAVLVRRIETAARELIFAGARPDAVPAPVTLRPTQNTLRFTFAAPSFSGDFLGQAQTQYRTRLDGLETDWTPWSGDTVREFSNLPFRALTFRVEARSPDGHVGPAAAWLFAIAPPWWLKPWAWAGYAALALLAIGGVVRSRTHALRHRAAQLEHIVATRTEQLQESNAELARLHAVERDEKLAARLAEEKASLEMLRYQLNPHFLYNTLASICGTAHTNADATRTMARRLADFCRLTLTRPDETDVVREEVRMLQSYLEIEKARWRDQLQVEIDVAPEAADRRLPAFLLLPLVENAIKHGGRTSRDILQLRLVIRATPDDDGLTIEVANTGVWDTTTPNPDSTGIGLENLRRRLRRYYADAHQISIESTGGWVVVTLKLAECRPPTGVAAE
jgi:signal transduction histidine kinase